MTTGRRKTLLATALVLAAICAVTACSSGGKKAPAAAANSSGQKSALPAEIKVMVVNDRTGPAGFAGLDEDNGIQLAADQATQAGTLGSTKIDFDLQDPAGNTQQAVKLTSTAINDQSYQAIIGPIRSTEQSATAPVAQSGKIPTLMAEVNIPSANAGDFTFLAGAPITSYFAAMGPYLKSIGVKSYGIIGDNLPSDVSIADVAKNFASSNGLSLLSNIQVSSTSQDYTAQVSNFLSSKPDALVNLVTSAAGATLISQVRQAGFKGPIIGIEATTSAFLQSAGKDAVGFTFPAPFTPLNQTSASTKAFVQAYTAKYGKAPSPYAAEGYDSALWLIKGIQASGTGTRTSIRDGLGKVATTGFDGAQGRITFSGRAMQLQPTILKWNGTDDEVVPSS
jgi:branched-chain amino acid transport system substrate-binding protein